MNNPASDIASVRDVTGQVLETLGTLRQRLMAAQVPDDAQKAQERLPVTYDALRNTHADLLNLAAYLRAALDDLDALERNDEPGTMDRSELGALAEEMDVLDARIEELMDELRDRRSRKDSPGGDGR